MHEYILTIIMTIIYLDEVIRLFNIKNLILERQKYALGVNTNPLRGELLSHIITLYGSFGR